MNVIILAGGAGTRLWPLSRNRYPKQFIKLFNSKNSLFQNAFLRSLSFANPEDIYIVTSEKYKYLVHGELEEIGVEYLTANILIEPKSLNTLPAIYYGVSEIRKKSDDNILVLSSDHIINDEEQFVEIVKASEALAKNNIITFGIKATEPNDGYGYIECGEACLNGYKVKAFKEKPNTTTAALYVENGYLWNSGMFLFNGNIFSNEVKKYTPDIFEAFSQNSDIEEIFEKITSGISVDYGVLEKSQTVCVVPLDIGWSDMGSFDAFFELLPLDKNNNCVNQEITSIDAYGNLVHAEKNKVVALIGTEDLIVIDKKDALLICQKGRSQEVKQIVEKLEKNHDKRVEYHVNDFRPWGQYEVMGEQDNYKIKKIRVSPNKKLSYQFHYHRSEHWVVVSGMAKVTIEGKQTLVNTGESIFIRAGEKHRLENPGKIPLEIIEVQFGSYLEEDDIIRIDDDYGR